MMRDKGLIMGEQRDRGAALLEFVLVVPLLLLLAFGTVEMGLAWVTNNRVEGATSVAARTGASSGAVENADRSILLSIQAALPEEALDNLERVVIFDATISGTVPDDCIPSNPNDQEGVEGVCNTYTGETVQDVEAGTDLGAAQGFWDPESRNDSLADPPDYLGVWVRTTHENVTGTFWNDFTITKSSVYRLQPDING